MTAPTLYHHFGDKEGLMRAMVARGITEFMTLKRANRQTQDPLADLRRGWNVWIAFAFERPNLFRLMVESTRRDPGSIQEAFVILRTILGRLRAAGRLDTDVETAFRAIWAGSNGVLSLFMQGASHKDIKATSDLLLDALTVAPVTVTNTGAAYKAGVRIAFGTDQGPISAHGQNAREFALLVKAGLTPADAILAATRNAADLLGASTD